MILGMGIVYLFLFILIVAIELQARIIEKYFSENESTPQNDTNNDDISGINKATIAAIIGAIAAHKSK